MSDILTPLTVSKRELIKGLSSAVVVVAGASSLSRTALAEDLNTEIELKGIDQSEAAGVVEQNAERLGLMILVPFEGPIKAYPVTGPEKTIQINDPNYYPPSPRTTLARTDLHIEVFDASPGHVWVCCPGGENICIQQG